MNNPGNPRDNINRLSFFATPDHDCNYLDGHSARTLFADPHAVLDMHIYNTLIQYGFRRSGTHIYRPACPACQACIPVRVAVDAFSPNRNQRRCWSRNQDLEIIETGDSYDDEHYQLYQRYISHRHQGGGMDTENEEQYQDFLTSKWSDTVFTEFRKGPDLLGIAVYDRLETGLSAVYTFFDPDQQQRSLGTFAVLWEIERCRQLRLPWLYLGYWIGDCRKMRYKSQFQPLEYFDEGQWYDFSSRKI